MAESGGSHWREITPLKPTRRILAAGLVALGGLEREAFPTFPFNTIEVSVAHPGAQPEEVEESIIVKIEEQVEALGDVKAVKSLAAPGLASVRVELKTGADIGEVMDEVKSAVGRIQSFPSAPQVPLGEDPGDAAKGSGKECRTAFKYISPKNASSRKLYKKGGLPYVCYRGFCYTHPHALPGFASASFTYFVALCRCRHRSFWESPTTSMFSILAGPEPVRPRSAGTKPRLRKTGIWYSKTFRSMVRRGRSIADPRPCRT